jgi:hypothetical protein
VDKPMYPTRKHDTCIQVHIMGPDRKPKPYYFCSDDCYARVPHDPDKCTWKRVCDCQCVGCRFG